MNILPSVALVGRPNVGKSRMFNRIVGKRIAIVHDMPGVTRDLATADVNEHFTLMDTGGIGMLPEMTATEIFEATEEQVDFAIQAASLVLFVTDGKDGCTPTDISIAEKLRKYNKKTLLVANKLENDKDLVKLNEFFQLGFGDPVAVSAEHGMYFDSLLSRIEKEIGPKPALSGQKKKKDKRIKICLTGRPNVGKSSLGNCLLNSERLIVSDVAGTTRDAIETHLDYETADGKKLAFNLVDTAGVRPKRKLSSSVEYFSTLRTEDAIKKADIAFLVLDAQTGVTKHDKKLAGDILEAGIGLVIVVNKWDLPMETFAHETVPGFKDEAEFRKSFVKSIYKDLFFLPDSPVIFTSAKENYAIEEILVQASEVHASLLKTLPTAKVNETIHKLLERNTPKVVQGKRFKVYYSLQVWNQPFKIRLYCNVENNFEDGYARYMETGFHKVFGLRGCPVQFELVGKPKRDFGEKSHNDNRARNTLSKHGKAREKGPVRRKKKR